MRRPERVDVELEELLDRIGYFAPDAKRVLVGYPSLVPEDTTKCQTAAPGQTQLPLADIPRTPCRSWTRSRSGSTTP
ncbi:hypothetical protein ACFQ64_15985 [Streptomyces sp. NPDC056460]|uniref:hypothetical protein n=1 Tax=Streptomyces sp. NPDC056460 TaxID=3345825 RepID=UPI003691EC13